MERTFFIPRPSNEFTLVADWQVEVPWWERNLVMLRTFKLTGSKTDKYSQRKYTVANPLFKDYDGSYAPAMITIPAGTRFVLSRYRTGYEGEVIRVDIKVVDGPQKNLKNRCLQLPPKALNGLTADFH